MECWGQNSANSANAALNHGIRNAPNQIDIMSIEKKQILDIVEHPNQEKYKGQKIFIINIHNYAYLVPFIENEEGIFLKTIIPSRKATEKYLGGKKK